MTGHGIMKMNYIMGSGCSAAVEFKPRNQEIMDSNISGCWAFSLLLLSLSRSPSSVFLNRFLKDVKDDFSIKMHCCAANHKLSLICVE